MRNSAHRSIRPLEAGVPVQTHNAVDLGSNLQQGLEPLCVVVLEGGQFVNHDHVEREWDTAFLHKPLDISLLMM